jgi:DDE superfamily endonuclease
MHTQVAQQAETTVTRRRLLALVGWGSFVAFWGSIAQELSPEDKAENTMTASIRILVEHVIAGVKRCRIVHDVFRNTQAQFDDLVMEIACGLYNLRAMLRYNACG